MPQAGPGPGPVPLVPCRGSCLQLCPQPHLSDGTPCFCSLPRCMQHYDGGTSSIPGTQHRCTLSCLQNVISKCHRVRHCALCRQPSSPLLRHQVSSPIQLFRSGRSAAFCCQPAISMTPFLLQGRLNINTTICILGRVGGGWWGEDTTLSLSTERTMSHRSPSPAAERGEVGTPGQRWRRLGRGLGKDSSRRKGEGLPRAGSVALNAGGL